MSEELLGAAAELLTARSGVTVPSYRWPLLAAELQRIGQGSLERGLARFERGDAALYEDMATVFAVGETYLFRGPDHYRELRRLGLRAREEGRPFNVLCAGVSTGEEAWSAVFVLAEIYAGTTLPYSVIGWDLSQARLERARQARFGRWSARSGLMGCERYLLETREGYEVVPELRRHASFEHVNLARPLPESRQIFDAIFFRNVSIYWRPEQARTVAEALGRLLVPGGRLFIGPSDPVDLPRDDWALELVGSALVYRRAERSAAPPPAEPRVRERSRPVDAATPRRRARLKTRPRPRVVRERAVAQEELAARVRELADRGEYEQALELLEGCDASSPALLELAGIVHLSRGELDAAVDRFRAAVYWAPTVGAYARWLEVAQRAREAQRELGRSTKP